MRALALVLALMAVVVAQNNSDRDIKSEFESMMELLSPPGEDKKLDEEASRQRVEQFRTSLNGFVDRWNSRASDLSVGRFVLGKAFALSGRPAESVPHFRAFLAAHAKHEDADSAVISLGSALLDSKDYGGAAETLTRFLQDRTDSAQRHAAEFYLGVARYQLGQVEEALSLFKSVAQSGQETPLVADANIKSIEILRDAGRVSEARALLESLLTKDDDAAYLKALKEQLDWIGKDAPDFTNIDTWIQGSPSTLTSLRGRVVVVNFFADRYDVCKEELKALATASAGEFSQSPVSFVGLTKYYRTNKAPPEKEQEILRSFLKEVGAGFSVAVAKDVANLHAYGVRGVPYTVVIGKDGKVAYLKSGSSRKNERSWQEFVTAIRRAASAN